jgi:hypothetical protein
VGHSRITWLVIGGVVAVLLFAGVDALRSSLRETPSPASAAETSALTTATESEGSTVVWVERNATAAREGTAAFLRQRATLYPQNFSRIECDVAYEGGNCFAYFPGGRCYVFEIVPSSDTSGYVRPSDLPATCARPHPSS